MTGVTGPAARVQVREGPEQQPALPGRVVIEPGDAGVAIVAEADDPTLPLSSEDTAARSPSDSFCQVLQHRGEVRVERVDHLAFAV